MGLAFSWSYSEGERAGHPAEVQPTGLGLQDVRGRAGHVHRPGVTPTIWEFSVRNEAVVPRLSAALGKRVVLHYREHPGIPTTCFGHTPYFVDSVSVMP